jgi:hypothetical protein
VRGKKRERVGRSDRKERKRSEREEREWRGRIEREMTEEEAVRCSNLKGP